MGVSCLSDQEATTMSDVEFFVYVIAVLAGCAALWWKVFRGHIRDHISPNDYLEAGEGLVLLGERHEIP
jgi:hypothetical protein